MALLDRARELAVPPPHGSPYSVPLLGTELPDRSPVYRNWRFQKELLATLDPHVCFGCHCKTRTMKLMELIGSHGS